MDSKVAFMKKSIAVVLMAAISTAVFAVHSFPAQCKVSGLRYDHANIILFSQHTAKPRLYAIQNSSKKTIWITHESNRGMSAGWDSQLSSQRWAALLMMHPNFKFGCRLSNKTGRMKKVPCESVLHVCQFSQLYSKNPISAGYWVGENLSLKELMTRIHARGFEV